MAVCSSFSTPNSNNDGRDEFNKLIHSLLELFKDSINGSNQLQFDDKSKWNLCRAIELDCLGQQAFDLSSQLEQSCYNTQMNFLFQFIDTFIDQLVKPDTVLPWLVGSMLKSFSRMKTDSAVYCETKTSITKLLENEIVPVLMIESILDTLKGLMELNSGVSASASGACLGSISLMGKILKEKVKLYRFSDQPSPVIVMEPVVCEIWTINQCERFQTLLSSLLNTEILKRTPPRRLNAILPVLLKQLEYGTWKLKSATLLVLERLMSLGLCHPVFSRFILDHLISMVMWYTENNINNTQLYITLGRCLTACSTQMLESLTNDKTVDNEKMFEEMTEDHLNDLLDLFLRLLDQNSAFYRCPGELQTGLCSVIQSLLKTASAFGEKKDKKPERSAAGSAVRRLLTRLLTVGSEIENTSKNLCSPQKFQTYSTVLKDAIEADLMVNDSTSELLLNEISAEGSYFENKDTLICELKTAFNIVTALGMLNDKRLDVVLTRIADNLAIALLDTLPNVQNNDKHSALKQLIILASKVACLVSEFSNTTTTDEQFDKEYEHILLILLCPWLKELDLSPHNDCISNIAQFENFCSLVYPSVQGFIRDNNELKILTLDTIALFSCRPFFESWRLPIFIQAMKSDHFELMRKAMSVLHLVLYCSSWSIEECDDFLNELFQIFKSSDVVSNENYSELFRTLANSFCVLSNKCALALNEQMTLFTYCQICHADSDSNDMEDLLPTKMLDDLAVFVKDIENASVERKTSSLNLVHVILRHCDLEPLDVLKELEAIIINLLPLMGDGHPDVRSLMSSLLGMISTRAISPDLTAAMEEAFTNFSNSAEITEQQNQLIGDNNEECLNLAVSHFTQFMKGCKNQNQSLFDLCYTKVVLLASFQEPSEKLKAEIRASFEMAASALKLTPFELHLNQSDNLCYHLVQRLCGDFAAVNGGNPVLRAEQRMVSVIECVAELCGLNLKNWIFHCQPFFIPWLLIYGSRPDIAETHRMAANAIFKLFAKKCLKNPHSILTTETFSDVLVKAVVMSESDADVNRVLAYAVEQGRIDNNDDAMETDEEWTVEKYLNHNLYECTKKLMRNISLNEEKVMRMLSKLDFMVFNERRFSSDTEVNQETFLNNYLDIYSRFLGILLDFGQVLNENEPIPIYNKRITLQSLTVLFRRVQTIVRRYSRMVLFVLRGSVNIAQLNVDGAIAWVEFVKCIEIEELARLLPDIMASIIPLLSLEEIDPLLEFIFETHKTEIENFNKNHVKEDGISFESLCSVLRNLPDCEQLEKYLGNESSDLVPELNACHCLLVQQQTYLKKLALRKLEIIFINKSGDGQLQLNATDDMDKIKPIFVDLVQALIDTIRSLGSSSERSTQLTAVRCLGYLGAIDPGRLGLEMSAPSLPGRAPQDRRATEIVLAHFDSAAYRMSDDFVCDMLKYMVRCLMLGTGQLINEACLLSIQEVLKTLDFKYQRDQQGTLAYDVWNKLSATHQQLLEPLLRTRYILQNQKELGNLSQPIINRSSSYSDWLKTWVTASINELVAVDESPAKVLFSTTVFLIENDASFARFLLPHVLVKAAEDDNVTIIDAATREIDAVLVATNNNNDINATLLSRNDLHLAAQTVFYFMDFVRQFYVRLQKDRRYNSDESADTVQVTRIRALKKHIGTFAEFDKSENVLNAAIACRSYARALMTLENANSSESFEQYGFMLEKLYRYLDEPDGVAGAFAQIKKSRLPDTMETILAFEASGSFTDALPLYETLAQKDYPRIKQQLHSAKYLLKIYQMSTSLLIADSISRNESESKSKSECAKDIRDVQVEALRKLQKWDELADVLENVQTERSWDEAIGGLLVALNTKDKKCFDSLLNMTKNKLIIGPLLAATLETGSSQRDYGIMCKLHLLHEVEHAAKRFVSFDNEAINGLNEGDPLLIEWKRRLKLPQQSFRTLEPILEMRRCLLSFAPNSDLIVNELHKIWLQSAKFARFAGNSQAVGYFLEMAKIKTNRMVAGFDSIIEEAKCHWHTGKHQEGIQRLRDGLDICNDPGNDDKEHKIGQIKTKLLLADYLEQARMEPVSELQEIYDGCCSTAHNNDIRYEHLYYKTAVFYDKNILQRNFNKEHTNLDMVKSLISNYARSLQYGSYYLNHSMTRLLSIWLDYCNKPYVAEIRRRKEEEEQKALEEKKEKEKEEKKGKIKKKQEKESEKIGKPKRWKKKKNRERKFRHQNLLSRSTLNRFFRVVQMTLKN